MAGGNKNIKPKDGKQFSKEYQPTEKWTEKKALSVGNDLLAWLRDDDDNIFFNEFLFINNDFHPNLIGYLNRKFSSFLQLYEKAKNIQEIKLVKFGCFDKLNATMTKFTLINNHDYVDKQEVKQDVKQENKVQLYLPERD